MENGKNLEAYNDIVAEEIRAKIDELSHYFDSIQVFATRHVDEKMGTTRFIYGAGNWYSRYGLVKHWSDNQSFESDIILPEDENPFE